MTKKKYTQCELYRGFFGGKTYKSGHIMTTVLVDDCHVDPHDQNGKKPPIAVTDLRKKLESTQYKYQPDVKSCTGEYNTCVVEKTQSSSGNWVLTLDPR
jgi:hypothetical protein